MAQLKDTVVSGSLRATDSILTDLLLTTTAQFSILRVPTTSGGTTYGIGAAGNALISNGSTVYWGSITKVGTIDTGVWQGTTIGVGYGGTGTNTAPTEWGVIYAASTSAYASTGAGVAGYLLQSNATSAPSWIEATNFNTVSTIVKRDDSGNFSASTITADLSGNATSASALSVVPANNTKGYFYRGDNTWSNILENDFLPQASDTHNIGSTSVNWNNIYLRRIYLYHNSISYGNFYISNYGTAGNGTSNGALGKATLTLGNNIARSSESGIGTDNARGELMIYGSGDTVGTYYEDYWSGGTGNESFYFYGTTNASANATGVSRVIIGNSTKKSEAKASSTGYLRLYGDEDKYHEIRSGSPTSNQAHYFPDASGWIVTGGNGSSTGAGDSDTPVYLKTDGTLAAISSYDGNAATATTASYISTPNTSGYTTDVYGNFRHAGSAGSTTSNWNLQDYAGTSKFNFYWETGNMTAAGTITASFSGSLSGTATAANYVNLYEARGTTTTLNKAANYIGAGKMFHLVATSSTATADNGKPPCGDSNILQMNWDNSGGYDSQLAIGASSNKMEFRSRASTKAAWRRCVTITPDTAVGGTNTPTYVDADGVVQACTAYSSASVNYATSAGSVSWANVSSKPMELGAYSGALDSGGWKALGGRSNGSKIYIAYNNSKASWNSGAYSSSIVFGCGDTKGLVDCYYNSPIVTFGGGSVGGSTDNDPKWYMKFSGTSGKTYTLPGDSKTLAAADGSNASGSWGISVTGSSASCTGNANSANYTSHLLGVNSSNSPYGYSEGNIIRAVWNVHSDNRWYFRAGTYQCRVDYANTATTAYNLANVHTNECIVGADGSSSLWLNYRNHYNGDTTNGTQLTTYYFGDRRGSYTTTNLYAGSLWLNGNLSVSQGNGTGGGIVLADDGSIVDNNDGYCSMRFSSGVNITNGKDANTSRISLRSDGWIYMQNSGNGLYWPNCNGAHVCGNTYSSYGSVAVRGSRNGYGGLHLGDSANYMTVMDDGANKGLFQEGQRWILYYNRSTEQIGLMDSSVNYGYSVQVNGSLCATNTIRSIVNAYPHYRAERTDSGEVSMYMVNNTAGWAMGVNVWGIGAGQFGIGQYSGTGSSTWRFKIDNNGYCFTNSYLNLGGGNEGNASSPPRILGFNGSDTYIRSYKTEYLDVNSAKCIAIGAYGTSCFTYRQTDDAFDGNSGWTHYLICNHGDGATYYHYTIGLPFWDTPMYRRQMGSTSSVTQWWKFCTEENFGNRGFVTWGRSCEAYVLGLNALVIVDAALYVVWLPSTNDVFIYYYYNGTGTTSSSNTGQITDDRGYVFKRTNNADAAGRRKLTVSTPGDATITIIGF